MSNSTPPPSPPIPYLPYVTIADETVFVLANLTAAVMTLRLLYFVHCRPSQLRTSTMGATMLVYLWTLVLLSAMPLPVWTYMAVGWRPTEPSIFTVVC